MSSPAAQLAHLQAELVNAYRTLQYIRWCQVSGLVIIAYDYGLTFPLELKYFWKRREGRAREHFYFLRFLFMMNRYLPIFTQILNTAGKAWFKQIIEITAILEWFAIPAGIVCYRTCALYGRNARAILALVGVYISALIATIILVVISVQGDDISSVVAPGVNLRACHSLSPQHTLFAVFIPPMTYDITMAAAALWLLLDLERRTVNSHSARTLRSMALHTVMYCCVIATADLTNMVIYRAAPSEMRHLFDGVMFALVSISCNRLLLHLRELGDRERTDFFSENDGTELSTLRGMRPPVESRPWQARAPATVGNSYGYF
ncbi:hypothetical protein EXIGLDRAFT_762833 [Exidia glandulosa HHB12029]|uniref:DUF6533 domain-containing protein n=1 Tax=Exidia glandulosa HHB12029 TaxID=1314781 RepID=A0A166BA21_EXIGL|nr:hypothetical protein EXIGLDRAFT_762833 [Exidia glandulosa HHB12029]